LQIEELTNLLKKSRAKSAFLFCHHNADLDSLCSAYVFGELLKRIKPGLDVSIVAPGGLSKLSKCVAQRLSLSIVDPPSLSSADLVVLLDVNTLEQLDCWAERIESLMVPILVIDHHAVHPETRKLASLMIVQEGATSTAEIIYRLWVDSGAELDSREALALFLGIAYDTRHFALANSDTFRIIVNLVDHGVDVEEALQMIMTPIDLSERLARLKAVSRAKIHRIGEWVIAVSEVSAFQASAARALLNVGADVAIVGGVTGDELRISMRSTQFFFKNTRLHLGRDIAAVIGSEIDGAGGGHGMSAGVNGRGDVVACLKKSLSLMRDGLAATEDPH